MKDFWRVSLMTGSDPAADLKLAGVPAAVTIYDATANILHPLMPHLRNMVGPQKKERYVFDLFATVELAKYLEGQGVTHATFDFEPELSGARQGYDAEAVLVADNVIRTFADHGITLNVFAIPDDPVGAKWMRHRSNAILLCLYPFTDDADLFTRAYTKKIAIARKTMNGRWFEGWIAPFSVELDGDGEDTPVIPWGRWMPDVYEAAVELVEETCDAGVAWWSTLEQKKKESYDPFTDPHGWTKRLSNNPQR